MEAETHTTLDEEPSSSHAPAPQAPIHQVQEEGQLLGEDSEKEHVDPRIREEIKNNVLQILEVVQRSVMDFMGTDGYQRSYLAQAQALTERPGAHHSEHDSEISDNRRRSNSSSGSDDGEKDPRDMANVVRTLCPRYAKRGECSHSRRGNCLYLHESFLGKAFDRANVRPYSYDLHARPRIRIPRIRISTSIEPDLYTVYCGHFQSSSSNCGQASGTRDARQWQHNLQIAISFRVSQLSSSTFSRELVSRLICSLFGSEASHPDCRGVSQDEFELSRAPKLFKFMDLHLRPYMSSRHGTPSWEAALAAVCLCGTVTELYRRQRSMLMESRPQKYTEWDDFPLCRQLFKEVLLDADLPPGRELWAGIALPESMRGSLRLDDLSNESYSHFSKLLDHLTEVMLKDYVKEPNKLEWLQEVLRPNLDLGHGKRQRHHRILEEFAAPSDLDHVETPLALRDFKDIQFIPAEISLDNLVKLDSRWKVEWTSSLDLHLVVRDERNLYMYWPSTTIQRQPRLPRRLRLGELRRTYALIFGNSSSQLSADRLALSDQMWGDPNRFSFGPSDLSAAIADPQRSSKTLYGLRHSKLLPLLRRYLQTPAPEHMSRVYGLPKSATMGKVAEGIYPDGRNHDIIFHVQSILLYPSQQEELFEDFPYFADRIRMLIILLQQQKPRGLLQLWRDSRDTMQWWTFWLVLIVGVPSLLLAFGSLGVSAAQTWASFKALEQS